jgi:hypothetical protein
MYEITIIVIIVTSVISVILGLLAFMGLVAVLCKNRRFIIWWLERSIEFAGYMSGVYNDTDDD